MNGAFSMPNNVKQAFFLYNSFSDKLVTSRRWNYLTKVRTKSPLIQ